MRRRKQTKTTAIKNGENSHMDSLLKEFAQIHSHKSSVVYAASGTQYMFSICKKEPEIAQ